MTADPRAKSPADRPLSESQQMYLKTVYLIASEKGAARVTDIARRLGVIKASVTAALTALARRGLLKHAPYDVVSLTAEGARTAAHIVRRYEAARGFLVSVLGISEEAAEKDACAMEHCVSDRVLRRLARFVAEYRGSRAPAREPGRRR